MVSTFLSKVKLLSKTVPRYLYSATLSTATSSMISSGTGGGEGGGGGGGSESQLPFPLF